MTAADKTLGHLRTLWSHDIFLLTYVRGKKTMLSMYRERLRREAGELIAATRRSWWRGSP